MSSPFVPIETADLIWREDLPYSRRFEDIYFSNADPLAESRYVFIEGNQLLQRFADLPADANFCVAETGFGTGLNFLLCLQAWRSASQANQWLTYYSCEKHPLKPADLARCHALWPELGAEAQVLQQQYPLLTPGYHVLQFPQWRCALILMLGEAESVFQDLLCSGQPEIEQQIRPWHVDAWFLDGFAPAKNESMWQPGLFRTMALLSRSGSTLATFTAARLVKDGLTAVGFQLGKQKGFGRKRDMLTGCFSQLPVEAAGPRKTWKTAWAFAPTRRVSNSAVAIVGAGLAGAMLANRLAAKGIAVDIYDQDGIAAGGSGNPQAILFPKLSAFKSPFTDLMLSCFLFARREYRQLLAVNPKLGEITDLFLLAQDKREQLTQQGLGEWLATYPDLGALLSAEAVTARCGLPVNYPGLLIRQSAWVDMPALCHWLLDQALIQVFPKTQVTDLNQDGHRWDLAGRRYDQVVIANGFAARQLWQSSFLPLKSIAGSMVAVQANAASQALRAPLCGIGHVLPARDKLHWTGASYHLDCQRSPDLAKDQAEQLAKLSQLAAIDWSDQLQQQWSAQRAASPDYLPMVGSLPDADDFLQHYQPLSQNSNRWLDIAQPAHPNLFLCTGFGSRGLTTIPLLTEWLSGLMTGAPSCLSRPMIQSISPARFLLKQIITLSRR